MVGYRFAADAIVVLHAVWVGVVVLGMVAIVLGAVLGWRWVRNFWFRAVHLAMIAFVVGLTVFNLSCPLTVLENDLRQRAGDATYPGSFIGYWAHELIFFDAPAWVFSTIYILFGLAVAVTLYIVPPRWPWRRDSAGAAGKGDGGRRRIEANSTPGHTP